jgi:signal transduction histidine kinase
MHVAALHTRRTPERPRRGPEGSALVELHAAAVVLAGVTVTLVWVAVDDGFFWPVWVWFALLLPLALHVGIRMAVRHTVPGAQRRLAINAAIFVVFAAALLLIWLIGGAGPFWPAIPLIGLMVVFAGHAVLAKLWHRLAPGEREQQLAARVDVLTRTRRGALDAQAAELRRIERDLHDGAQSRLVALTLQLGRAEARLADRPDVAEIVHNARIEAGAAIAELRDLARGIAPPVLADRGLPAAAEALGRRAAVPVTVDATLDRRPPPVLESAAYFVVAEALTNVDKHARASQAHVAIALAHDRLTVEVSDDGLGGAACTGSGLTGLRHRVEALDGTLVIDTKDTGGTSIRAELPCER